MTAKMKRCRSRQQKPHKKAHDTAQKRQSWDNRQYLSAVADLREISRE
jgi:hypothetical protein